MGRHSENDEIGSRTIIGERVKSAGKSGNPDRAMRDRDVGQVGVVKRAYRAERRAGINDQIAKAKAKAKRQESNKPAPITAGS